MGQGTGNPSARKAGVETAFFGHGTGNPSATTFGELCVSVPELLLTFRTGLGAFFGRGTGLVSARAGITETASTNARREKRTTEFHIELLLFIIFWDSLGPGEWGLARPKDTSFEAC